MTAPRVTATGWKVLEACRTFTTVASIREAIRPPGCRVLNGSGLSRSLKLLVAQGLLELVGFAAYKVTTAGLAALEGRARRTT